jgi:RHS repeat-associated protein
MTPGIVGESDLSGNLTDEYVFFDGKRVARKSTNGVFYYFFDHQKTASVITDSAGRLVSAVDGNGTNYVSSASYNPDGSLKALLNGSTPALNQSFQYTPRLQLCRITVLTSGTLPTSCGDTNIGNVMDRGYNFNYGAGDNGNVMAIINYRDASRSQSFTYDPLNRLTSGWSSANTGAYSWGENYSIDAWGNLQISPMGGKAHGGTFQLSGNAQNRPTGMAYDAAGNLMSYLSSTYTYDQENRISSTAGTSYTYDGNGERLLKSNTSTGAAVKRYWSMGGNTLAEADGSGNLTAEYIYFGSKRVARIDLPANTVHYYLSDHLGSTSIVVSAAGTIEEESDYYPFGTEVVVTAPGMNELKFTGKRRDTESQLDYFGARYYSNVLARFANPDYTDEDEGPVSIPFYNPSNPASLNMYSYAHNNPITNSDPDGHDCVVQTRTSDHSESVTVSAGNCAKVNVGDGQSKTYVPGTVTGISAGTDGKSIDIGYKPYVGDASSSVFTADSAPVPDRPGLAYGYNAAGYQTLGTAGATMTDARTYAIWTGASALGGMALIGSGAIGGGGGATIGEWMASDLTDHAVERLAAHGISPAQARAAMEAATKAGNVVKVMGRYGPQLRYVGNGVKVIVAMTGSNAGKIVTAFWK